MTASPTILDSDFRYIDKNGILMKSRTELSIAQMLSFLGQEYEYDHKFTLEGKTVLVDFKTKNGLIEVIDNDEDLEKYKQIKKISPETKIMAVGHPKNNLLVDFGDAKKIIKEAISFLDHKFFINREYLKKEDDSHYNISFKGQKGMFELQVPKDTTYLLEGEATVENLSTEIIKILVPKLPKNVEAIGVYIYEGYNKGAHIISQLAKS